MIEEFFNPLVAEILNDNSRFLPERHGNIGVHSRELMMPTGGIHQERFIRMRDGVSQAKEVAKRTTDGRIGSIVPVELENHLSEIKHVHGKDRNPDMANCSGPFISAIGNSVRGGIVK